MTDDHAARDPDDAQLIERGDYARLLERHRRLIRQRVGMYLRGADAEDAASEVILYLYAELTKGKRYDAPFRVVVWRRAGWIAGDFARGRREFPVEDHDAWHATADEPDIDDWRYVRMLLDHLGPRDREVFELTVYAGLTLEQIAGRLGITRNAVDQALFRARKHLRRLIDG
jgi:RNA polymerase sigma factor (sigma-70 family)